MELTLTKFGRLSELKECEELSAFLAQLAIQLQGVVRLLQPNGTPVFEATATNMTLSADCLRLLPDEELITQWQSSNMAGTATCGCGQAMAILPIRWQGRVDGFLTVCPAPIAEQSFLINVTGMIEAYLTLARNAVQMWEKKSKLSAAHETLYRETELLRDEPTLFQTVLRVLQKYLKAEAALFIPRKLSDSGWDSPVIQNDSEVPQKWIETLTAWVCLVHEKKRCPLIISTESSAMQQELIVLPENLEEQQQFMQLGGGSFLSATVVYGNETLGRLAFCNRRIVCGFSLDDLAWLQSLTGSISLSVHALRTRKFSDRFLENALHSLKTPIHSVQAIAETLVHNKNFSDDERTEWLTDLYVQTQRLTGVMQLAKNFSRLEKLSPVSLNKLVTQCAHDLRVVGKSRQISLQMQLPQADCQILADENALYVALQSVLENALKFSPPGGAVKIDLIHELSNYRISVTDQGPGVPEVQQEIIFQDFVSIPRAGVSESSGLGLPFARAMVERHGGKLICHTVPGTHGACFSFFLPQNRET